MKLYGALKTKMAIVIAVVTVCFGTMTALAVMQMTEQAITRMASKHAETIIAWQKTVIEHVIDDSIAFANHLGSQQMVTDYLQQANPQEQYPRLLKYIDGLDADNRYQAIYIMDRTGRTLSSTDPSFVGQNYAFRAYFKGAIAGKPTVDAAIGVTSGKFGYYFSCPIKTKSGKIIGVVVAKLKESLIADALHPQNLSVDGAAMLVDTYGIVIQSDRPESLFKSLGTLSAKTRREIAETKRFNGVDISSLQYDWVAKEITTQKELSEFVFYDQSHKRAELVGAARITDAPFFVVIIEARKIFAQAADNAEIEIGLLIFFAAVATMLVLILLLLPLAQSLSDIKPPADNGHTEA